MREQRKTLSLFLVFALLLNLFLPTSLVSANAGYGTDSSTTVTEDAYGNDPEQTEEEQEFDINTIGGIGLLGVASDQEISENIITKVKMYEEEARDNAGNPIPGVKETKHIRLDQGALVWIEYEWKLKDSHGYTEGATFTFDLPDKFLPSGTIPGYLNGGGVTVGTFVVSGGQVTFTFNDEINDDDELTGYFYIWRQFDESKFSGGTEQEVEFPIQTGTEIVTVNFKSKNSGMTKTGTKNKGKNPNKIVWVVDFNKSEAEITNAVFEDVFPSGLEIDLNSIAVYELNVNLDGSVTPKTPKFNGYIKEKLTSENGFKLTFSDDIDKAYRVEYTTDITEISDKTYKNTATVSGNSNPKLEEKSDSVSVEFSKPLDKTSTAYDSNTQTITWKIEYNYNEQVIEQINAWLEDTITTTPTLTTGFDIFDFEVYQMTINDDGSATKQDPASPLTLGTNYEVKNLTNNSFRLEFKNQINSAYEITYKTKAKDRIYGDKVSVKNEVEMDGGIKKDWTRDINQVIFSKRAGTVDYANKTIEWIIDLNDDKQTMENVIITDNYEDQGLELIESSLEISGLADTAYELKPNPSYDQGFEIEFNDPVTASHVIRYKTTFDPTDPTIDIKTIKYKNLATLEWKEGTRPQTPITKFGEVTPNPYTKKNGNKTGSFDATKKEISWEVDVNYNLHDLTNAVFQDIYTRDQTFKRESLEVHKLNIPTGGGKPTITGQPLSIAESDFEYIEINGKIQGFRLKLGDIISKSNPSDIKSAYRITYTTSLEGHPVVAEYNNNATLFEQSTPSNLLFEESDTVNLTHGGEYVHKTGCQGGKTCDGKKLGDNPDIIYWQVDINRSQSYIAAGAQLNDVLTGDQFLLRDSFKLYGTNIATNGTVTKDTNKLLIEGEDYELEEFSPATFTLTFKKELHTAYILEYQSFINANDGETISNKVTFAGQFHGSTNESDNKSVKVDYLGAGGGASPSGKGQIKIIKIDADTVDPVTGERKRLAGATFELYDKTGNILLETLVTDADGEAEFKDYKYKEYLLKEASAPSGYLIDSDYGVGKVINFKPEVKEFTIENKELRQGFEFMKVDQDDTNKGLEGAVFKLTKNGVLVDTLTSDVNGKVAKGDLEAGNYELVETTAPIGYELDSSPISFTITVNQTELLSLGTNGKVFNKIITDGSVELTKVDDVDGTALADVVFELQDADGNVVELNGVPQNGLTTGTNGKITISNLPGGSYRFVETKALEHYEQDFTPLEFEIVEGKKAVTLTFENKLIPGSVKLIKVDKGNKTNKLQGAEFKLLDAEGKVLRENLTTDENGEFTVNDLRPGEYQFIETKAPSSYYLNRTPIDFEIVKSQSETLEITVENEYDDSSSGGGGGTPPEDPEKDKEDPKDKDKDPKDKDPKDKDKKPEEEPKKPVDPEQDPEQPNKDTNTEEDPETEDGTTGSIAGNTDEDIDSQNTNNARLSDADEEELARRGQVAADQDAQRKGMLPQTGETLPITPFIGVLLLIGAFVLWFRKGTIRG